MRSDEEKLRAAATFLWGLLDDVSTLGDACKGNAELFMAQSLKLVERRSESGIESIDGYTLDFGECLGSELSVSTGHFNGFFDEKEVSGA